MPRTLPEPAPTHRVEVEWESGHTSFWAYRIDGDEWLPFIVRGHDIYASPVSDKPEHLRDAVVDIAYQNGLSIHSDDVMVEGLHAEYCA